MTKIQKLGWIAAAALGGILLASGFQDTAMKVAVVDLSDVVEKSNYGKANQETFAKMKKSREDLLQFIDDNRVLTNEQAQQLKDFATKETLTPADQAKVDSIKAEVVASNKKWTELSQKATLTPEDRTLLDEYARRSQSMDLVARRWFNDFTNEMQNWADKQKAASIVKARAAVQSVAKAQGYTIVFEVGVAPYGANDLTDAALKAMDAGS